MTQTAAVASTTVVEVRMVLYRPELEEGKMRVVRNRERVICEGHKDKGQSQGARRDAD